MMTASRPASQFLTDSASPAPPTDLAALRRSDPDAIDAVYREHAKRLRTVALRLTTSVYDADDIVHDVFLRLPLALQSYEERGRFSEWLTTLVIRAALMHERRERVRRHASIDQIEEPAAPTVDGDSLAGLRVVEALKGLSPSLRHVFVLRAVHEYTHAEIAELLGITTNTSEVRMHRAVQQLRAKLGSVR